MKKHIALMIFLIALVLTACSGNETATPVEETQPEITDEVVEANTPSAPEPSSTTASEVQIADIDFSNPMACNVVGLLPPMDPTQQAVFAVEEEQAWTKGPDGASVTIVEYSDFQ